MLFVIVFFTAARLIKFKNEIHSNHFPIELKSKESRLIPSILIQLEIGSNEFYFYLYFVLQPELVAKIGKTKNKKQWPYGIILKKACKII